MTGTRTATAVMTARVPRPCQEGSHPGAGANGSAVNGGAPEGTSASGASTAGADSRDDRGASTRPAVNGAAAAGVSAAAVPGTTGLLLAAGAQDEPSSAVPGVDGAGTGAAAVGTRPEGARGTARPATDGPQSSDRMPAEAPAAPAQGGEPPVFSVRNLWKVFGPKAGRVPGSGLAELSAEALREQTGCTVAVRDVSFDVRPGECFVVMGLSGSGKSTLVRCLTRLIEPTSGTIAIDGEDVRGMDKGALRNLRRHRAAMVFQHFGLLPHRTVLDNVAYGLEIQGVGRAERRARAAEMVEKVGLAGMEGRRPSQLSGGQQQRVGLARALAADPEVLLFDEPFSALDPLIRRDMQEEVVRLNREEGRTMVFITHDLAEALRVGHRIALMRDGRVVQCGTPEEIVGSPADDYVRDFVRDVPREQVLSVRRAMRPAGDAREAEDGPALDPATTVAEAIETVARTGGPARVVEGERCLGVVDFKSLLRVVAGLGTGGRTEEKAAA